MKNVAKGVRFDALEAWRGIAALAIVAYHSSFLISADAPLRANSALFVDFFFVLSGFVICHAYRDRIGDGMRFSEYILSRLARIYPLHLVMLAVWAVFLTLKFGTAWPPECSLEALLANLFLVNSIGLTSELTWNYPSWSIGAEFVAYLLFFWVVSGLRGGLSFAGALAISVLAYGVLTIDGGQTLQRTHDLGAVRCVGGFFLGAAVYALHEARPGRRLGGLAEVAIVAVVAALLLLPPGSMLVEITTIAAFAALVYVFAVSRGALSMLLGQWLPQFLGRISYSIYMVHALFAVIAFHIGHAYFELNPVAIKSQAGIGRIFLVTPFAPLITLGVILAVVIASALTYRVIEAPARDMLRRFAKDFTGLARQDRYRKSPPA